MGDCDYQELERKMLDAIDEVVRDTNWAPPNGGILIDALVVMIHRDSDGHYGTSWVSSGSREQAEGMARYAIRSIDAGDRLRLDGDLDNEND